MERSSDPHTDGHDAVVGAIAADRLRQVEGGSMSRKKNDDKIRGHFFPMFYETRRSPAWKQLSFGARELFAALRMRCFKNNKHVYLSQRDAGRI